MGKSFWPVLLIVTALGAAAIWSQTPRYVTRLPEGARGMMRAWVQEIRGLPVQRVSARAPEEPLVLFGGTTPGYAQTPGAGTAPENARAAVLPSAAPAPAPVASPVPAPASVAPAAPAAQPVAVASVRPASPAQGDWCVLKETTPVQGLDDRVISHAPGGRFFLIERRARPAAGRGTLLIGNFTPKRLPHTVQVNSRHVLCLTGSPDDLSTTQLHALKMYYQLRGEALDYLAELHSTKGDVASPFYKQLQEAERIRDFRAKELAGMVSLAGDQRAVEESELARLKQRAAEIREQHEAWKRAHTAQVEDPTRDPHYQALVREYRNYTSAVPAGLALE